MFANIFTLYSTYKRIILIVGALSLAGTLWWYWDSYKDSIYQKGFDDAVSQYSEQMLLLNERNRKETEQKLITLRLQLKEQHNQELARVKEETVVDTRVEEVIRYIDREIYVKEECNTVDPSLIRMFNETIDRVNSSTRDQ